MSSMKAIRIHEYGGPDVLRHEDAPRPDPHDDEILVRVIAAGVNPIDWKIRAGFLKDVLPLPLPWIPGQDFSGVVESLGQGVTAMRSGGEVFGKVDLPCNGSYAEYVTVPTSAVALKPRTLDHVHAAAIPLAALTAWQALFGDGQGPGLDLRAGQSVLILGASGGVGSFAVQFAKWKGARVVGTARHGRTEHVRALGADVVIDLDRQRLEDAGQVDAVLDLVGGALQQLVWPQIRRGGALASTMGPPPEAEAKARGVRTIAVATQTDATQLTKIAQLIDDGVVKVVVDKTLPLHAARRAHELLETGGVRGKVVLEVASETGAQ